MIIGMRSESRKLIMIIRNKPYLTIGIVGGSGLLMVISGWLWQFGLVLGIFSTLAFLVIKDEIVCTVLPDQLVIAKTQQVINFTDIVSYQLGRTEAFVEIFVQSGDEMQRVVIQTYNARKLQRTLNKYLPGKDANQLRIDAFQANRLSSKEIRERKQQ
jgi:hypothetical protein